MKVERFVLIGQNRKPLAKPIDLSRPERIFLLYRLSDYSASAEAILHHPDSGRLISPWGRQQVLDKIVSVVTVLRDDGRPAHVIGPLMAAIYRQGIEGNLYFRRIPPDDPRRSPAAFRQVEGLRIKVARATGLKIQPPRLDYDPRPMAPPRQETISRARAELNDRPREDRRPGWKQVLGGLRGGSN